MAEVTTRRVPVDPRTAPKMTDAQRRGDASLNIPIYPKQVGECKVCGVALMSKHRWAATSPEGRKGFSAHAGRGLCRAHHHRDLRYGDPLGEAPPPTRSAPRPCVKCKAPTATARARAADPVLRAETRTRDSRGMCRVCYRKWRRQQGDKFVPTEFHKREDVLEDWVWIRDHGDGDLKRAADRMGLTLRALELHLSRARARGDLRGSTETFAHDMRRSAA